MYFLVGNLHPAFRAQQRFIHLALLVKYDNVKCHDSTYSSILKPLLQDLTTLQAHGIDVVVNGVTKCIKGKLVSISADKSFSA